MSQKHIWVLGVFYLFVSEELFAIYNIIFHLYPKCLMMFF